MSLPKLGKRTPRADRRTLRLASYLDTAALPAPPPAIDRSTVVPAWPVMLNNQLGDCTIAAAAHLVQLWTAEHGSPFVIPDAEILDAYSAVSGYDPTTGANDNGAVEIDVLNFWRQTGIGGKLITGYAALQPSRGAEVQNSVYLFGGVYAGVSLPRSAQAQVGGIWDVPTGGPVGDGSPGTWGGHAIPIVGYDATGLTCITWGAVQRLTWAFWSTYTDEAYALISTDWASYGINTPEGFNYNQLVADLRQVGSL